MTGTAHESHVAAALASASVTHPYYARALRTLRIVPSDAVQTMSTAADWTTYYNPATVLQWTVAETGAVLVHELSHLLFGHHDRCGERDQRRFNVAGDAEINQSIEGLPEGAVYPESIRMPRGRTAEVYYAATDPGQDDPDKGDGDGDGDGDGQPGQGSGSGQPGGNQPGKAPTDCGSAAGGSKRSYELPGGGVSQKEIDSTIADTAKAVLQSEAYGTAAGDDLREWALGALAINQAQWYSAIASIVGEIASPYGAPTHWAWPGRRDERDMGGAVLPRWRGERPKIAVVIDTSGSITPFDLDMAKAAGQYVKRAADATFYGCDTDVTPYGRDLPDTIYGGGGTDMRVGIAKAIRDGAKGVVVITDGHSPWPDTNDGIPLVVALNPTGSDRRLPAWARVITFDD